MYELQYRQSDPESVYQNSNHEFMNLFPKTLFSSNHICSTFTTTCAILHIQMSPMHVQPKLYHIHNKIYLPILIFASGMSSSLFSARIKKIPVLSLHIIIIRRQSNNETQWKWLCNTLCCLFSNMFDIGT